MTAWRSACPQCDLNGEHCRLKVMPCQAARATPAMRSLWRQIEGADPVPMSRPVLVRSPESGVGEGTHEDCHPP